MTTAMPETDIKPFFPDFDQHELHCNVQISNPPKEGGRAPECGKTPAWPVETICECCKQEGANNMCAECLEKPLYCPACYRASGRHIPFIVFRM